jgi:protein TonB
MPNDPPPPDLYQEAGPQAASAPQAPQIEETPRPVAETAFTVPAEPPRVSPATALTISTIGWEGPLREGGTTGAVISSRLLDNTPRARSQRPPQFPFEARHAGLEGHVLVEFTVDETGHVLNPCVLSSNDARFDAPTLAAIGAWRFEPGRRDGRIVRFRMQVPVDFKLSEQ